MWLIDHLKELVDTLVKIDKKIGFIGLLRYVILILVVFGLFNFKSVVKGCVELVTEIQNEIHTEKMEKRDQLLAELVPILAEFRGEVNADRILYFEYHNSKENLVGIPFKYLDLVLQNTKYGIIPVSELDYKDINAGMITNLYETIKYGDAVYYSSQEDSLFKEKFPEESIVFKPDGSEWQLFLSIPGVSQPVGIIIIEWMDGDINRDTERIRRVYRSFIPRISGLILSKQ